MSKTNHLKVALYSRIIQSASPPVTHMTDSGRVREQPKVMHYV